MSKSKDETDDWMNPPKRDHSYSVAGRKYPRFLIQRERRLDYFPFTEWGHWATFDTREERDAALVKLRHEHPVWQLRASDELRAPMAYY